MKILSVILSLTELVKAFRGLYDAWVITQKINKLKDQQKIKKELSDALKLPRTLDTARRLAESTDKL